MVGNVGGKVDREPGANDQLDHADGVHGVGEEGHQAYDPDLDRYDREGHLLHATIHNWLQPV